MGRCDIIDFAGPGDKRKLLLLRLKAIHLHFAVFACLSLVLSYVLPAFLARDWSGGVVPLALVAMLAMLGLAVAESLSGARRISVVRLDATHVWFKGMGEAIRASLPGESQSQG